MNVAVCHSTAAAVTLRAVAHAVITSLMGEEITVLVADAASQMYLKTHFKVNGWTLPHLHTNDYLLEIVMFSSIIIACI